MHHWCGENRPSCTVPTHNDGHRVLAKYYSPEARTQLGEPDANKGPGLQSLKEQRAFEKGLFAKTKRLGGALLDTWTAFSLAHDLGPFPPFFILSPAGDIILYNGQLSVYKHSLDLIFYMLEGRWRTSSCCNRR